jgi:hypothetical protein
VVAAPVAEMILVFKVLVPDAVEKLGEADVNGFLIISV